MTILILALAPVLTLAFYIYIKDKYEKEPIKILIRGYFFGTLMAIPIIKTENYIMAFMPLDFGVIEEAFYSAFAVAAFVEEGYKFIFLFFLYWNNNNYNEKFDGIVYGVFISLGFAGIENVLYVLSPVYGGFDTAISRAFFSVPAHAIFGVIMGYYMSVGKFTGKKIYLLMALLYSIIIHGIYDFILLADFRLNMVVFYLFMGIIVLMAFRKIKQHIEDSPFKVEK